MKKNFIVMLFLNQDTVSDDLWGVFPHQEVKKLSRTAASVLYLYWRITVTRAADLGATTEGPPPGGLCPVSAASAGAEGPPERQGQPRDRPKGGPWGGKWYAGTWTSAPASGVCDQPDQPYASHCLART